MAIFGGAISLIPFRRDEKWAWWILWYFPVFFVVHVIVLGTLLPDLFLAILSVLALLLSAPRMFTRAGRITGRSSS